MGLFVSCFVHPLNSQARLASGEWTDGRSVERK